MPELPEVETVKTGLSSKIIGQCINDAIMSGKKMRIIAPKNTLELIKNASVLSIDRRSKYLYINLNNMFTIIFHLGMSGSLTMQKIGSEAKKHDHLILKLDNLNLHFNDPRRFGFYDVQKTSTINNLKYIKNLGLEPLSSDFTAEKLLSILNKYKRPIKNVIMDSSLIVGIGNIYASEALFTAKINPKTPANAINKSKVDILYKVIVETLEEAIKAGGSSLKDHRQADGTLGYFQHKFNVYGRSGLACKLCNSEILKINQAGRSTFYCPKCQH